MRTLIVTAADANFFPLLQGLLLSLQQWREQPFTDIAVLDLGLSPGQRAWVARAARHIVEPGWDLPVSPAAIAAKNPHHRAVTARPFLPRYFPGYDIYVWLDADTWVQDRSALDMCIAAAAKGPLAAIPEIHPTYQISSDAIQWRGDRLSSYFGREAIKDKRWDTYVNSGVFGLPAAAPHWGLWAKWLRQGLDNSCGRYFSDQTALNHAVWTENLPVTYLPARCNWMCHFAIPRLIQNRFCEPDDEGCIIGILHLTGYTKNISVNVSPFHSRSLRYAVPPIQSEGASAYDERFAYKGISF